MSDLPDTVRITVAHGDEDGKPVAVYSHDGDRVRHIAGCANVACSILATEQEKQSLIRLGEQFNHSRTSMVRY